MGQIEVGRPIKMFLGNLLKMGFALRVDNTRLVVEGDPELMTPVLQAEVVKRSAHLIDLLTPEPPAELGPYFGRLLTAAELKRALKMAEGLRVRVDGYPCNGGWLLLLDKRGEAERVKL